MTIVASFIFPIPRPTTVTTTTTFTQQTTTTITQTTNFYGPPPVRVIGYFTGCNFPNLPRFFVPAPIRRIIERRMYIVPYIVPRPWYVLPPFRAVSPGVLWRY